MSDVTRDIRRATGDELIVANWVLGNAAQVLRRLMPIQATLFHKEEAKNGLFDVEFLVSAPETRLRLEIKVDYKGYKTGNVYLEVCNDHDEPAGLSKTQADLWAHFVPAKHLFLFDPRRMLRHIADRMNDGYVLKNFSGDGNARGMTIPVEDLAQLPWVQYFNVRLRLTGSYDDEAQSTDGRGSAPRNEPPRRTAGSVEAEDARRGPGRDAGRARPRRQV